MNAYDISLERGRLRIVVATVVINVVAVSLLTFAPWSDWRTGAALNIVDNCLLIGFTLVRRDALLGRFLLFGIVVGFCELPADAWLVDYTGTLDYSIGGGPMIWRSPLWMPLAWEVVAVQFGYVGLRLWERLGRIGLLMIGLLGAINIPFYEEIARRIHWWQYSGCRMISLRRGTSFSASSESRSRSRCLHKNCGVVRGAKLLLLESSAEFRFLFAMPSRFGSPTDWSGKVIHCSPAGAGASSRLGFLQNQMAAAQTTSATVMTRKASLNAITNASRVTSDLITAYDCLSAIVVTIHDRAP